jgi:hypothetical protein
VFNRNSQAQVSDPPEVGQAATMQNRITEAGYPKIKMIINPGYKIKALLSQGTLSL